MKRGWTVLSGLLLVMMVLTGQSMAEGEHQCVMGFDATVYEGPSVGLTLTGELAFDLDEAGGLTGHFTLEDATEIPVAGQVVGHAIHLIFTVAEDQYIFGVGTALTDVTEDDCGTVLGGPFVGPAEGDFGDWGGKGKPGRGVLN